MKPREINPECVDDDAWWDCEALKLAVIDPHNFNKYAFSPKYHLGSSGLAALGLLDTMSDGDLYDGAIDRPFNQARIANFGSLLMHACQRVSKCK